MNRPPDRSEGRDRGSGSVLALGAIAALFLLLSALLVLGAALIAGGQARTAADLAALAGAGRLVSGEGPDAACRAAGRAAELNGARLRSCAVAEQGALGDVRVEAEVELPALLELGGLHARALGRAGPVPADPDGPATISSSGTGRRSGAEP